VKRSIGRGARIPQKVIAMKDLSIWCLSRGCAILAAALVVLSASLAEAQTVEEIIAKNIKAQGGRDALTNLKSLQRKGEVDLDGAFGQMEGTVEEVVIPWKKAYSATDLGAFAQKDGWNGTVAWRDGMMGIQEIEGEEASQIKQAVDLNPFVMIADRGTKAERLDDEAVEDVDYYVIQLTPTDGPAVKLFVDKESDHVMRVTFTQNNPMFGEVEIIIENSDYEDFGGVKLPTKIKAYVGDVFEIETTYTETKVNGEIDEAIFEIPKEESP
jgi:hypothetical protein